MENLSFCSFEPRSHSKLTIRPASSKRPRVSCFGDGPAAAHPPARTSQSVLQAEIEKAHGGLQEHHGEDRDENQHAGVDPVEGIWKAEQRCSPRACTAPGSRAPGLQGSNKRTQLGGRVGLFPGRAGDCQGQRFGNQRRHSDLVLTGLGEESHGEDDTTDP